MKRFVISSKPAAKLNKMASSELVKMQRDMKRRFRSYQRGGQQGLPMIWDNMMAYLKSLQNNV